MRRLVAPYDSLTALEGTLRDSLWDRLGLILDRCAMEAEAHLALHHSPMPLNAQLKTLAGDPTSCQLVSHGRCLITFDHWLG